MSVPDRLSRAVRFVRGLSPFELLALLLIAFAIALRLYEFWKLPGINGDEAWYGVQAQRVGSDEQPVQWRTPTGNFLSPMQAGALWLLHLAFDPSPSLLRVPTLGSSLLAVAVVGIAAGRTFGRAAGFAGALICAALPVNIAYARFGWDPSHLALWGALAIYAALRRRLLAAVALYAFGLWVHPTHVFIAPLLVIVFATVELSASRERRAWVRAFAALVLLGAATALLKLITKGNKNFPTLADATGRLVSLDAWNDHAVAISQFFLGSATYEYIAGAPLPGASAAWATAFWTVLLLLLAAAAWRIRRTRDWTAAALVTGAVASHLAFFVLAGPQKLAPHMERFGLCLVVPSVFALVALLFSSHRGARMESRTDDHAQPSTGIRVARIARAAALVAGCLALMAGFSRYYLVELKRTGSASHWTFWTGPIEPKALAVRRILSERRPQAPLVIVTDGWWTSWIARYLTAEQPDVTVADAISKSVVDAEHVDLFVMGYASGPAKGLVNKLGPDRFERRDVPGYARTHVVSVWRKKVASPKAQAQ